MKNYPFSALIARQSGSNFYSSFFFLSREKRNAILAIYAFSRLVDDAVDEAPDAVRAREEIEAWRRRFDLCRNGLSPQSEFFHPVLPELTDAIRRFEIPKEFFLDLLAGVEMDLAPKRFENFPELEKYCYHVAGTIGLLCNHVFGYPHDAVAKEYAILLGTAFQLTNILRDIGSDARRGRIYLPQEDLARFGISESQILEGRTSQSFENLMDFEAARAEDYFERATARLPYERRKRLIPAEIMAMVYHQILKRLRDERYPVFEKKIALSKFEKVRLLAKTLLSSVIPS